MNSSSRRHRQLTTFTITTLLAIATTTTPTTTFAAPISSSSSSSLPSFSSSSVSTHNTSTDCYISLFNHIYNLSPLLSSHSSSPSRTHLIRSVCGSTRNTYSTLATYEPEILKELLERREELRVGVRETEVEEEKKSVDEEEERDDEQPQGREDIESVLSGASENENDEGELVHSSSKVNPIEDSINISAVYKLELNNESATIEEENQSDSELESNLVEAMNVLEMQLEQVLKSGDEYESVQKDAEAIKEEDVEPFAAEEATTLSADPPSSRPVPAHDDEPEVLPILDVSYTASTDSAEVVDSKANPVAASLSNSPTSVRLALQPVSPSGDAAIPAPTTQDNKPDNSKTSGQSSTVPIVGGSDSTLHYSHLWLALGISLPFGLAALVFFLFFIRRTILAYCSSSSSPNDTSGTVGSRPILNLSKLDAAEVDRQTAELVDESVSTWTQCYDETGRVYYVNCVTGQSQWQLPVELGGEPIPEGLEVGSGSMIVGSTDGLTSIGSYGSHASRYMPLESRASNVSMSVARGEGEEGGIRIGSLPMVQLMNVESEPTVTA